MLRFLIVNNCSANQTEGSRSTTILSQTKLMWLKITWREVSKFATAESLQWKPGKKLLRRETLMLGGRAWARGSHRACASGGNVVSNERRFFCF